jgi:hypothetical protein
MVDDDYFPDDREVWEVTHVREEDVETTECEGVDFLTELLDLSGWTLVDDETRRRRRTCLDYTKCFIING